VIDSGFQMASTCPSCQGVGTVIPRGHHCRECDGIGKVRGRKSVKVDIPAGQSASLENPPFDHDILLQELRTA
jgi:DnaJ-class molecular chaperone